jgi:hypothetical protein
MTRRSVGVTMNSNWFPSDHTGVRVLLWCFVRPISRAFPLLPPVMTLANGSVVVVVGFRSHVTNKQTANNLRKKSSTAIPVCNHQIKMHKKIKTKKGNGGKTNQFSHTCNQIAFINNSFKFNNTKMRAQTLSSHLKCPPLLSCPDRWP